MTLVQLKEEVELSMTVPKGSLYKRPEFGHRFKELAREVCSDLVVRCARAYALEALQWMIDLGHADSMQAISSDVGAGRIYVSAEVFAKTGSSVSFSRFVEVSDVQ
jgi:phage gp46-like protein